MSERPTPETDAAYKYWPSENAELVDSDFARRLERERDEAREDLAELRARYNELLGPKEPKWFNCREIPANIEEGAK